VARATIWAPGAIPEYEAKYAVPLKRYAIPAIDLILAGAGVFAITNGIPSFEQLIPVVAHALALVFIAVALSCLVGAVFPRFWRLEMVGKVALITFCGAYAVALFIRGTPFTGMFFLGFAVWIGYRLWILGDELGERRDGRTT
jgi:hypothetical protein